MKVGAPFNPYKVFQGVFAPYWVLEHRGISTGAKLCYIRLLGFAGRDARCYPSLDTLDASLGVSERQARDYVKELERAMLIAIEQRGLRKTNVYLFLWSVELERLSNSVPGRPEEDRNYPAGLDRNRSSGPIGMNSPGKNSLESSSSSAGKYQGTEQSTRAAPVPQRNGGEAEVISIPETLNRTAQTISAWATERRIQRLRRDKRIGLPEKEQLAQWAVILDSRGIVESDRAFAVMDAACNSAERAGEWRNWAYLTLQIQLAAERLHASATPLVAVPQSPHEQAEEDPDCDWTAAKAKIRSQIPETAFLNWFAPTRQVERRGTAITVAVPDDLTRCYLTTEYDHVTKGAVLSLGIDEAKFIVQDGSPRDLNEPVRVDFDKPVYGE